MNAFSKNSNDHGKCTDQEKNCQTILIIILETLQCFRTGATHRNWKKTKKRQFCQKHTVLEQIKVNAS